MIRTAKAWPCYAMTGIAKAWLGTDRNSEGIATREKAKAKAKHETE